MDLYFAPLACSLAPRIMADEFALPLTTIEVDLRSGRTIDGQDFAAISPLRQVPSLRLDSGEMLFENVAILDHLGALGSGEAAPRDALDRTRILRWLCFLNSELHAIVFHYLLGKAPAEANQAALAMAAPRFAVLESHLADSDFLLDRFTAADAYLSVILNWAAATRVEAALQPALAAYRTRLADRPSVARLIATERELFRARRQAAPAS